MREAERISENQYLQVLAHEGEVLARLDAALVSWCGWAKAGERGRAPAGRSMVLRRRMANVLIEHAVAMAVLQEAKADAAAGELDDGGRGDERAELVLQRVERCLRLAAEEIGASRGEGEAAWMREELAARGSEEPLIAVTRAVELTDPVTKVEHLRWVLGQNARRSSEEAPAERGELMRAYDRGVSLQAKRAAAATTATATAERDDAAMEEAAGQREAAGERGEVRVVRDDEGAPEEGEGAEGFVLQERRPCLRKPVRAVRGADSEDRPRAGRVNDETWRGVCERGYRQLLHEVAQGEDGERLFEGLEEGVAYRVELAPDGVCSTMSPAGLQTLVLALAEACAAALWKATMSPALRQWMDLEEAQLDGALLIAGETLARLLTRGEWRQVVQALCALGMGRSALDEAETFLAENPAARRSLPRYQAVRTKLDEARRELAAGEALVRCAVGKKASGEAAGEAIVAAKIFCSEAGLAACRSALKVCGGWGASTELAVEQLVRDTLGDVPAGPPNDRLRELIISPRVGIDPRMGEGGEAKPARLGFRAAPRRGN